MDDKRTQFASSTLPAVILDFSRISDAENQRSQNFDRDKAEEEAKIISLRRGKLNSGEYRGSKLNPKFGRSRFIELSEDNDAVIDNIDNMLDLIEKSRVIITEPSELNNSEENYEEELSQLRQDLRLQYNKTILLKPITNQSITMFLKNTLVIF